MLSNPVVLLYRALVNNSFLNGILSNPKVNQQIEERLRREGKIEDRFTNSESLRREIERHRSRMSAHPFKDKHLWIKKATGLGITEFMLRFMAWLCLRNDDMKGAQMVIITGPNQELAIKLIRRMKDLFKGLGITFDSKETVLNLNGCSIEAFPSNHIDAFRSLTNLKFILLDEADFFRKNEQEEVRNVAERYIAKSDPYIVMVSTPNRPDGLFNKIEKEPYDKSIYKKIVLDYTYGENKIYTKEEIANAMMSFDREYRCQYQGLIGNVVSPQSIERCQKIEYNPLEAITNNGISIGIDPSFGSSKFGIVATRFVNERIEVIFAEEYDRPDFNEMVNLVMQIQQKHGDASIFVDAANPEIWQSIKKRLGEEYKETAVREKLEWCRKLRK